jgi:adenosylmethionine-8-amino-7-oxononanoate aminotransferase
MVIPSSNADVERGMSAVLHRNLRKAPLTAVGGEGAFLIDSGGKRYLDASGGAAVSCLGHGHPAVIAAVQAQVAALPYAHGGFFTSAPAEVLAALLIARAPSGFGAGRVSFVGGGSEAMEVALKLARQYFVERGEPSRSHFIARRMSYHGNTLGALAVGGHMQRRAMYAPMLMDVSHIPPCYAYREQRDDETEAEYGLRAANALEAEILRVGPETVAAFVAEPVVGATLGCVPAVPGYFTRIREICDTYGVLFIADEVMCGMGRTGTLFALESEGVQPDIITIGKGLGAGYQPIGATLASQRVVDGLTAGSGMLANGHTYMNHPVACAAALAVLRTIEAEGLLDNVRRQGAALRAALDARLGQIPEVGDIRGAGLFQGIELVTDRQTKTPFPRSARLADTIKDMALEDGLICYPSSGAADGILGDHVLLAPPYIVDERQVVEIADRVTATIRRALSRAG